VRSGNESKYPAEIARRTVDRGWYPNTPWRNFMRSIEVNYWRLAWIIGCTSSGLFRFITYIPVVGQLRAFMMGFFL